MRFEERKRNICKNCFDHYFTNFTKLFYTVLTKQKTMKSQLSCKTNYKFPRIAKLKKVVNEIRKIRKGYAKSIREKFLKQVSYKLQKSD